MKTYKKLLYTACLAGTCILTGCDSFLTPDNKSSVTDVDYFATAPGFQSLVYDAYAQLSNIYNSDNVATYFNSGTDLYQDGRNDIEAALHRWSNFTPENGTVKTFYTDCYDGIRSCLAIGYYAPSAIVSDDVKQKAIDEGRFVKALFYYLLVNNYGGVPLITEYASSAIKGYPRATAEQVYTYIIDELKEIIGNNKLAASTATRGGGEASIEAAKALLAKTYLSAAWDLNKADYFNEAARYADEVINGRSLTTEFSDLWAADRSGDDNAEFLFDVEYDYDSTHDQTIGNRWQSFYCGYYGGAEEGMKYGASAFIPLMHTLKYFEPGDKRYDATFMKTLLVKKAWNPNNGFKENGMPIGDYFAFYANGKTAKGKMVGVYYPAYWECDAISVAAWRAEDPENRANTFIIPQNNLTAEMEPMSNYIKDLKDFPDGVIAKYDFTEAQRMSWTVSPCCKFDDSKTAQYTAGKSFRDLHVITLPEIFLVAAEAYLKINNNDKALARMNALRTRAGLSAATHIDIDAILKESACESFGNGYRRMDLRRTGKLVEYNNLYNPHLIGSAETAIGKKLLWPIPQAAIDANDLLNANDQNPGY
ncbi:RagB/SusD family nutrient uptake outer membrane protein [Bacteroides heparinolyticus]|uniref:RagB/SusD family nutrient uptake outer membrane protein n=1 Tax=Prevotella heparinolytica TaxID=28113 RepID=UPI003F9FBD58